MHHIHREDETDHIGQERRDIGWHKPVFSPCKAQRHGGPVYEAYDYAHPEARSSSAALGAQGKWDAKKGNEKTGQWKSNFVE